MLKIRGRSNSLNVQKVMWAVAELGVAHERIDAGGAFGKLGYRYHALDIERPELANVTAWYERLKAREAFATHVMIPLS